MQNPLDLLFPTAEFFWSLLNILYGENGKQCTWDPASLRVHAEADILWFSWLRASLVKARWEAGVADTESCVTKLLWQLRATRHMAVHQRSCEDRKLCMAASSRWWWVPRVPLYNTAGPGLWLPPNRPSATTVLTAGRVLGLQHGNHDQTLHQLVVCRLSAGHAPCKSARAVMWYCWAELKTHKCLLVCKILEASYFLQF